MNEQEIKDVLDHLGYYRLREELPFKLWLKGITDHCDPEELEQFLDIYQFEDEKPVTLSEFVNHFYTFMNVKRYNDLPITYM